MSARDLTARPVYVVCHNLKKQKIHLFIRDWLTLKWLYMYTSL